MVVVLGDRWTQLVFNFLIGWVVIGRNGCCRLGTVCFFRVLQNNVF